MLAAMTSLDFAQAARALGREARSYGLLVPGFRSPPREIGVDRSLRRGAGYVVVAVKYLSLFAGVGGFDLGADAAGWECVGQVEWDKHCQQVLQRHWPTVPKWADVNDFHGSTVAADVVVGGFPCQDVSVAGQRKGLVDGTRSNLYRQIIRIVKEMRDATSGTSPRWVILENVVGLLSVDAGKGFGQVLDDLAELGALVVEWAMVDTQWLGPPQRRQRIFVAACFDSGTARRCPDPLFPLDTRGPRHTRPSRQASEIVAALTATGVGTCGADDNQAQAGHLIPIAFHIKQTPSNGHVVPTIGAEKGAMGVVYSVAENQRGELRTSQVAPALTQGDGGKPGQSYSAIAYPVAVRGRDGGAQAEIGEPNIGNTLRAGDGGSSRSQLVLTPEIAIRRLTPLECERLQGWPDNHTRWGGADTVIADTHRYRMIGNGISAPVAQWVTEQISRAEQHSDTPRETTQ